MEFMGFILLNDRTKCNLNRHNHPGKGNLTLFNPFTKKNTRRETLKKFANFSFINRELISSKLAIKYQ